jgi:hypothetical protein
MLANPDGLGKPTIPLNDGKVPPPFFIVSAGRSGTTLLRRMLLSHYNIHIPPESNRLIPHNASYFISNNTLPWNILVEAILRKFEKDTGFKYWNVELSDVWKILINTPNGQRSYARIIFELYRYHGSLIGGKDIQRWGDKTPCLIEHISLLRLIFPKARFIHMVRDGRAVVHSLMRNLNYTMEQATQRWKSSIQLFNAHLGSTDVDNFLQIRYEDLVENTPAITERICQFLSVPFLPGMADTIPQNMGDTILSHHAKVLTPLMKSPSSEWKGNLSHQDYLYLSDVFKVELARLGYA